MSSLSSSLSSCRFCNEPFECSSEQSVCCVCHAFLYDYATSEMINGIKSSEEKDAYNDSGTEELELELGNLFNPQPSSSRTTRSISSCPYAHNSPRLPLRQSPNSSHGINQNSKASLETLPSVVLSLILRDLDDFSIWSLRKASPRLRTVIDHVIPEEEWAKFVSHRFPIFVPRHRISSWRALYLNMMESVTCRLCLSRLHLPTVFPIDVPPVRFRRAVNEIRSLCADPPYGIKALALDTENFSHCLAGITGPPLSPYEGGLFYVHILIPDSHPMRPPIVRFLTRILHPNISFHGDIGLDCIRDNWSLILTLDKVLLSIQSLLTEPYTRICMEPAVGRLYSQNRDKFEMLARLWTWKYACHDYLSADFVSQLTIPDVT
ncbi:unnamed protein product [Hymenolepis diminuta]|uniref:UBIQUITIN_CONJUGAT_2 domain-containing protein n=1 Tax=Hymenolepis diminuta TaxID=6216 RepID=A0A564Y5Q0_HYMDI|nr:unnamed protein product [Hymenolepis diminuta]